MKKIISMLLMVCMFCTLLPVTASATETTVEVSDAASFVEALAETADTIIKLTKDISIDNSITADQMTTPEGATNHLTIDLNGYHLYLFRSILYNGDGTLTIKGDDSGGEVANYSGPAIKIASQSKDATLEILSGTIKTPSGHNCIVGYSDTSKILIRGGTIEGAGGGTHGITSSGSISIQGGTSVISGGKQAMNKAPDTSSYSNVVITASTNEDGSDPVATYNPADIATYKYLKFEPAVQNTVPSITTQPVSATVTEGSTATFTVAATGTPAPTYRWVVNRNDGNGFVSIPDATSTSYTTSTTSISNNGYKYKCIVTNSVGEVISSAATLTVNAASVPTYKVNVQTEGEGTASANITEAAQGVTVTLTATPNDGYQFKEWQVISGDITIINNTFTMPANEVSVKAVFEKKASDNNSGNNDNNDNNNNNDNKTSYKIIDGANSTWTPSSDGTLSIRGDGEVSKFVSVKVDGVIVDAANYTVTSGSTIITFTKDYLNTLSAGNHTFDIAWTDGSASTSFTVNATPTETPKTEAAKKDDVPKTGDSNLVVWLFITAIISGSVVLCFGRKRKQVR